MLNDLICHFSNSMVTFLAFYLFVATFHISSKFNLDKKEIKKINHRK